MQSVVSVSSWSAAASKRKCAVVNSTKSRAKSIAASVSAQSAVPVVSATIRRVEFDSFEIFFLIQNSG